MHKTLIITGGSVDVDAAFSYEEFSEIIAVDGGIEAAYKMGIVPTHMIGDFDTVDLSLVAKLKEQKVQCITLNPHKDQTDTQEAVDWALKLGSEEIWIIGAIGTRMDHTLANIGLLEGIRRAGCKGYILNSHNKMYLVHDRQVLNRETLYGPYVSLIPFTQHVTGVTLKGFAYPLEKQNFETGVCPGWGVSNELVDDTAVITVENGVMLVMETRD